MTSNSPTLAPYYVSSGPKHVSSTKEFTSSHFQAFQTRHFALCQLFVIISPWSPHLLLRRFSVFRQIDVQVSLHSLLIISLPLSSDLLLALVWIRPTTPHIVSGEVEPPTLIRQAFQNIYSSFTEIGVRMHTRFIYLCPCQLVHRWLTLWLRAFLQTLKVFFLTI